MKASTLLFFTLCLTACGVARPVLESDNTKVEVKVVEKIVKDTAWFELPVIVAYRKAPHRDIQWRNTGGHMGIGNIHG